MLQNCILPEALSIGSSLSLTANIYFVSSSIRPRDRNRSRLSLTKALVLKQQTVAKFFQVSLAYSVPSATNLVQIPIPFFLGFSVAS